MFDIALVTEGIEKSKFFLILMKFIIWGRSDSSKKNPATPCVKGL